MRTVLISPSWTLLLDTYSHCSTDDRPPVDLAFYFLGLTSGSKNPVHWICVIFRARVSRGIPKLSDCCWVPLRGGMPSLRGAGFERLFWRCDRRQWRSGAAGFISGGICFMWFHWVVSRWLHWVTTVACCGYFRPLWYIRSNLRNFNISCVGFKTAEGFQLLCLGFAVFHI